MSEYTQPEFNGFKNEQPEHKIFREILENEHDLGRLTVEQCTEFMQEWVEITGGEHEPSY